MKKIIVCVVFFLLIFTSGLSALDIYFSEKNPEEFFQVIKKTTIDTITWKIVKDSDLKVGRLFCESAIENSDSLLIRRGRQKLISFIPPIIEETKLELMASSGILSVHETDPTKRNAWEIVLYYLFAVFVLPAFFLCYNIKHISIVAFIGSLIVFLVLIIVGCLTLFFAIDCNNPIFGISIIVLFLLSIPASYRLTKLGLKKKKR